MAVARNSSASQVPAFPLPPFDAASLRRLAWGISADPTVMWPVIPEPDHAWDPAGLRVIGQVVLGSAVAFVRRWGRSTPWTPPDWASAHDGLRQTFLLDRFVHFLRAEPIAWCNFTEPQITKGFAHFLNDGSPENRIGRTAALLAALGRDVSGGIMDPIVIAEAPTRKKFRLDIFVKWKEPNGQARALAIEAKFGHHLTPGQLPGYKAEVKRYVDPEAFSGSLYVISRAVSQNRDSKSLRRNKDWRWISWKRFLLRYEQNLAPQMDDDAFRIFRRTVWKQI